MVRESEDGLIGAIRGRYAARLGIALLLAVVLLLVLGVVVHAQTASTVRDDANQNLETSAAIQSDEVNEWAEGNQRQVRTVSQLPTVQSADHDEISQNLSALIDQGHVSDEVVAIHVVSKDEKQIISSSKPDKFVGKSPAEMDEPFVPKIKEGFSDSNEVYVSEPFRIPIADFPIVAMLSKVPDENRIVVFMINPTGEVGDLRQPIEGGQTHVVTADGTAVAAPNNETISGPATDRAIRNALSGESGVVERDDGSLLGYSPVESQNWVVLTHVDRSEVFALVDTVRNGIGGMVLVALFSLGLIGVTVGRNTATSLRSLADDARDLGEGDLEVTFDIDRPDEIGTLSETLAETRDSLRAQIEEAEDARADAERERQRVAQMNDHLETKAEEYRTVMRAAADGDLTSRMDPESENEAMAAIADEFNQMIAELEATAEQLSAFAAEVAASSEEVTASTEEVHSASAQVTESIQEISDGAERQNENLKAVNGEMNGLSTTTEQIAASSNDVADLAKRTAMAGREGRNAAREAIEGMNEIEAESDQAIEEIQSLQEEIQQIDELIEFITDVAEQTNMLALNANIEASRSGSAGSQEFGVVAEEVKGLATETRDAAGDAEDRIESIKTQTERTAAEVQETSDRIVDHRDTIENTVDALEEIADYAAETSDGVQEISAATEEQAASTEEVVSMVDEAATISEETTAEAETVAAAGEEQTTALTEVSRAISRLSEQAAELSTELDEFETDADVDLDRSFVADDGLDVLEDQSALQATTDEMSDTEFSFVSEADELDDESPAE